MKIPSQKQIEAYTYRYIRGMTLPETSVLMGITRRAVSGLLKRLKGTHPKIFPHSRNKPKMLKYRCYMDSHIRQKM